MMVWGRVGYTLSIVLATVVAAWLLRNQRSHQTLSHQQRLAIAIGAFVGATMSAKLPFVIFPSLGAMERYGWLGSWLSDGKTVLWGLAGGYVGVEFAKWWSGIRVRTGDGFVVPVAAAIAVGRIGCLMQGCCYGIPTNQSWGLRSLAADGGQLLRHPAALYEIGFHAGFAILAYVAIGRRWLPTQWMLIYLISYSAYRFVSETWREEPIWYAGMTFYQCSTLAFGLLFTVLLVSRWGRAAPVANASRWHASTWR